MSITKKKKLNGWKVRNPEKVVLDKYYHPKVFKSKKIGLRAKEADQELKDYLEGKI
jgi:hypothetical protein